MLAAHLCAILKCDAKAIGKGKESPGAKQYVLPCSVLHAHRASIHPLKLQICVRVCVYKVHFSGVFVEWEFKQSMYNNT